MKMNYFYFKIQGNVIWRIVKRKYSLCGIDFDYNLE